MSLPKIPHLYTRIRNYHKWSGQAFFWPVLFTGALLLVSCQTTEPVTEAERREPGQPASGETTEKITREQRAVWIATVSNIDWPSEPGLQVEQQKEELLHQLDRIAAMNMNAVILQVRPSTDALYDSPYEPWSAYLTGQMGEAPIPYYDPLEFAISEAHKRGLELHAWFNPYRAAHPNDPSEKFSEDHVSNTHPDWVIEYGNYLWLDPGLPEASEHSRRVMLDVATRYDVDGIHLDDYFYPYPAYDDGADFPDSLSWQRAQENGVSMSREDWRRHNVDMFIKELYEELKEVAPHVKFGISPIGVWRPNHPETTIFGFDAYEQLYADARRWLNEGWMDNFIPQLYHLIDNPGRPFPVMLNWWKDQNLEDRHLWAGLHTNRVYQTDAWPYGEITGQIYTSQANSGVTGSVHFSIRSMMENPVNGLVDHISRDAYKRPVLIPTAPWLDDTLPAPPEAELQILSDRLELTLRAGNAHEQVRWWVIRSDMGDYQEIEVAPGQLNRFSYHGSRATIWPKTIFVTAVDRLGNESTPIELTPELDERSGKGSVDKPEIVARDEWGKVPGGRKANAVRRNLSEGDTLRFRDLTIVLKEMISGKNANDNDTNYNRKFPGVDSIRVNLYRYGVTEERTVPQGYAFNWYGYHIGVLAVNTDPGEMAGGLTEMEISTVASISQPPAARAGFQQTGESDDRLRVPHRIVNITLHHTGSAEPLREDEDPVERLTGLYEWGAAERNWWDVPYHYLIDLDGTIYEGRDHHFAGETNTTYDPAGHFLISVIGNYNYQEPNEQQIESITELMAWAANEFDVPTDRIYGHYQWADSGCPGDHLRPYLEDGTLQQAVRDLLDRRR